MADDSAVCDESEIVTAFLLATCRLHQPSRHNVLAAETCSDMATRPCDDDDVVAVPLTTGSAAEFYIQPMFPLVGDVDVMYHHSNELAIPDGCPPPSQLPAEFHSCVTGYEIVDSEYPGYVYLKSSYLLIQNTDTGKYDVLQDAMREFVSYIHQTSIIFHSLYPGGKDEEFHGPAGVLDGSDYELTFDTVDCVRCLVWPTQAADWPTRHRIYGWPDSATVDRVVSNGCDLVRVAHRQCRQNEWMGMFQRRLSFSRAELVLLNSWRPVQQIVYHMLRVFVKTERLTDFRDSTGTKMISNYHIKTLMLWACEVKPKCWWVDDLNVVRICVVLMHIFADWLKSKNYRHYFVNNCSLIDTHYITPGNNRR